MRYVTVEVKVDESDDGRAEDVLLKLLGEVSDQGSHGILSRATLERALQIKDWQVVEVTPRWSDEARGLRGGHD